MYAREVAAAAGAVHGLHAQSGDQPLLFILEPLALINHLQERQCAHIIRLTKLNVRSDHGFMVTDAATRGHTALHYFALQLLSINIVSTKTQKSTAAHRTEEAMQSTEDAVAYPSEFLLREEGATHCLVQ